MVEEDGADGGEGAEVVLIGRVVAVPGDDVQRGVLDGRGPEGASPLDGEGGGGVAVFEGGDGGEEVARVGEAVGSDGAAFGESEGGAVVFADVSAGGTGGEFCAELYAARNDADFSGSDVDGAELGAEAEGAFLRDDEEFAVGVVEIFVLHGAGCEEEMGCHAGVGGGVSCGGDGADAFDEGERVGGDGDGVPAERGGGEIGFRRGRGAPEGLRERLEISPVRDGRADTIEPGAFVGGARRGERRAGDLFGVEAVGAFLRGVAADGERAG